MSVKVYIDGREGTTGLKIYERLGAREDIELLYIPDEYRKDFPTRRRGKRWLWQGIRCAL